MSININLQWEQAHRPGHRRSRVAVQLAPGLRGRDCVAKPETRFACSRPFCCAARIRVATGVDDFLSRGFLWAAAVEPGQVWRSGRFGYLAIDDVAVLSARICGDYHRDSTNWRFPTRPCSVRRSGKRFRFGCCNRTNAYKCPYSRLLPCVR